MSVGSGTSGSGPSSSAVSNGAVSNGAVSNGAGETFTERARRAQIVQAAIDTVNELGYPRASLAEIARRAGVAKSAIMYYFETKDALLLHVLDHVFTALDEQLTAADDTEAAPQERLRQHAQAYLDYIDVHRAGFAAGVEIVVSHRDADGVPLYLTGSDEDSALLRTILADGMTEGEFRTMDLGVATGLVEALIYLATTQIQRDLDADLTALKPEILTVLFQGLAPVQG